MNIVTIITPCYNAEKYIKETIESVLSQDYSNFELIIVNDCSTDRSEEIIKSFNDSRIKYYKFDINQGVAAARNFALDHATGKYVTFLDSDDLWLPDKLKRQIFFMEENNVLFSCTAYAQMDAEGNKLNRILTPPKDIDYNKCIRLGNPIGNLTAIYNQDKLGKFKVPNIKKRNDFALWLQILKKTNCVGLSDNLAVYRLGRKGSVSANKLAQIKYHWQLYHDIEGHGLIRSAFEIGCWVVVKTVSKISKRT